MKSTLARVLIKVLSFSLTCIGIFGAWYGYTMSAAIFTAKEMQSQIDGIESGIATLGAEIDQSLGDVVGLVDKILELRINSIHHPYCEETLESLMETVIILDNKYSICEAEIKKRNM